MHVTSFLALMVSLMMWKLNKLMTMLKLMMKMMLRLSKTRETTPQIKTGPGSKVEEVARVGWWS